MNALELLACCHIFVGNFLEHSVIVPHCQYILRSSVYESNFWSANAYFVVPVFHRPLGTFSPICTDFINNVTLGAFFLTPSVIKHCSFDAHLSFDSDSNATSAERIACATSPQPFRIVSDNLCLWHCPIARYGEGPTIFSDRCDTSLLPWKYIDHSGFGHFLSRLLSGILDIVESIVSTTVLTLCKSVFVLVSGIVEKFYNAVAWARPLEQVLAFLALRSVLRGPFLFLVLTMYSLLLLKLNSEFSY